jgi:glutamate-5-semialdehyde dehydrogenase
MNLRTIAKKANDSLDTLALSSVTTRNGVLIHLAEAIKNNTPKILEANKLDTDKAKEKGLSGALIDRLALTEARCYSLSDSLKELASLPDPLGAIEDLSTLENGLLVGRMRIPLGVIAFICEARPGAVVEAASMALKSGNAILIKPGKESYESSRVLGNLISSSISEFKLPEQSIKVLVDLEREEIIELIKLDDFVDLVIPRGGEGLIRFVTENSKIPVLKHYKGVCHLYVDENADLEMAKTTAINAKASRPATCNFGVFACTSEGKRNIFKVTGSGAY